LLECSSCRTTGSAGGKNIINEQDGSPIQTGISLGAEGLPHGVYAIRGSLVCKAICGLDPPKRLPNAKIKGTGQASGQSFGLVVTALHPPPPVQGNRYDPGVARQSREFASPGLCKQVAHPRGEPGIALVFQPQAEITD